MGSYIITAESGCSDDRTVCTLAVVRSERLAIREARRLAETARALELARRGLERRRGFCWSFAGEEQLAGLSRLWPRWGSSWAMEDVVVAYVPALEDHEDGHTAERFEVRSMSPGEATVERLRTWFVLRQQAAGGITTQVISELVGKYSNALVRDQASIYIARLRR